MTEETLNSPADIINYFNQSNFKFTTVDDFVCCLPKKYREQYVVGFSSVAGQNGLPYSPRVIMFDVPKQKIKLGKTTPPPKFMFSFNGGKEHNTQPNAIEMTSFNPKSHELEFYDIQFTKDGPHLSPKNPGLCMVCHGEKAGYDDHGNTIGQIPFGGPKYIFDTFGEWPRFVGGSQICDLKQRNILQDKLSDKAISVVSTEPRYRCLDKAQLKVDPEQTLPSSRYHKLFSSLMSFDLANLSQEHFRANRWVRNLPEFEKYKYFLYGYDLCGSGSLTEWFPTDQANKLLDKIKIDSRLKTGGDPSVAFAAAVDEDWQNELSYRKSEARQVEHPDFQSGFTPSRASLSCSAAHPDTSKMLNLAKAHGTGIEFLSALDETLHGGPGPGGYRASMRLFLDGEGYGTGMITTVLSAYNSKLLRSEATVDLEDEPKGSKIRALYKEISTKMVKGPEAAESTFAGSSAFVPIGGNKQVCEKLKKLSMDQFGGEEKSGSEPGRRISSESKDTN